jgi:hypothetical protein
MIAKTPPERPNAPGMRGSYGQGDFVESAQRDRLRKDQHFAAKGHGDGETPDPYGAGGFAAGGDGQSGYGAGYGQLEAAQRHEKQVSEHDLKKAGTASKSNR